MYTKIPSVQILISLLKQFNVRHMVLSPGTRNTALVGSIEEDPFFQCYSIVDERSAGYFALGIAETLNVPVCVSCTAATATANYAPAMKEAYERGLMLIALTADQDEQSMFHMEDQCINQVDMFHDFVRLAVDLPKVENKEDYWYCNRRINEALLEMDHHGKGPIQINYRMSYHLDYISSFPEDELPVTRKIDRIEDLSQLSVYREILLQKKKILLVCGSMCPNSELKQAIKNFYNRYNCAVVYDTFSNQADSDYILPGPLGDIATTKVKNELKPDLIIIVGKVFYSTIKYFIPGYSDVSETWQICEDGLINDGYHNLKYIFECIPFDFFYKMSDGLATSNDHLYDGKWKEIMSDIRIGNLPFTNFKAIETLCKSLPDDAILHTSVLDAIRMSNYVSMPVTVECFANIGADGIDGAFSTLLGQAYRTDKPSFLLVGDLSLMYDMNAFRCPIGNNVHICVINNYAGAEFHKNFGKERIPLLEKFISAGHSTKMHQCYGLGQMKYLSASNLEELEAVLPEFVHNQEGPVLLEVFTNADEDAKTLKEYWTRNRDALPCDFKIKVKSKIKQKAKSITPRSLIRLYRKAVGRE